ncbi:MAG: hypothetical protein K8J31_21010 [Anaerolineae bacterium]|nr:hypothetical protein [Anaerolineae bacterium]
MNSLSTWVLSILTYLLAGYLVGLMIGLTAFDPDTDVYALSGAALALIGMLIGIVPFFRRRVNTAFGMLVGFYLGMILTILLWGNPQTDDLLEFLQDDANRILAALAVAGIGGLLASRLMSNRTHLPALALLLGGFVGGAIFVAAGAAPPSSMVGLAPFVIGSGLVCALVAWFLTNGKLANP